MPSVNWTRWVCSFLLPFCIQFLCSVKLPCLNCLLLRYFPRLDSFLHGGLRVGQLTELVGQSSSGKTQALSQESKEEEEDCMATRLLIIDSISSLITPILGGTSSQGRALMTSLGFLLKKLAHEHNIAVLVTNHMVGAGEGGSLKPALGESWKSIPHVRLMLSRSHGSNSCKFSTLKHPSMVS
ncbi:DNA repair protein RAD51 homolog 4 [Linum grandiflorum]